MLRMRISHFIYIRFSLLAFLMFFLADLGAAQDKRLVVREPRDREDISIVVTSAAGHAFAKDFMLRT